MREVFRRGRSVETNPDERCPFCEVAPERVFHSGAHILGVWDGFPVSPGHALLVPRRHVANWFEASVVERNELAEAIEIARVAISERHDPDGFNVGMNLGAAAGQTVPHLHVHVIPRYAGDVEDPRGGVRWVVPSKADYWSVK
jgi:diadenosine tetraphosphate (Ap4A) HIT family hydrolase